MLAQRGPEGAEAGRWEFPGGKCDPEELNTDCLKREFREEFGVEIAVYEQVGSAPFSHKCQDYLLVGYRIRLLSQPTVLHEHVAMGWFDPEGVLALDLPESDRALATAMLAAGLHLRAV